MSDRAEAPSTGRSMRAVRTTAILGLGAIAIALLADVDRESASVFGVEGPTCPLGSTFGEESCPGCGLTRSVSFAMQGEVSESFAMHPAGPIIALCLVLAVLVALHAWGRRSVDPGHRKLARGLRWMFLLALAIGSIWRIARD